VDGISGRFFVNRMPKTPNRIAYDRKITARLWDVSADLVGMTSANPVTKSGGLT
jgi:hypothetical protein